MPSQEAGFQDTVVGDDGELIEQYEHDPSQLIGIRRPKGQGITMHGLHVHPEAYFRSSHQHTPTKLAFIHTPF